MKTRRIEIEIAGPDADDATVTRIIQSVNDFVRDEFLNFNIAIDVHEKNSEIIFPQTPYPLPIPQWDKKPDNIPDWWYTQPTCSVTTEGENK